MKLKLLIVCLLVLPSLTEAKNSSCEFKFLGHNKVLKSGSVSSNGQGFTIDQPPIECSFDKLLNSVQKVECKKVESENSFGTLFYRNLKHLGKIQKFVIQAKEDKFRLEYICT